MTENTFIHMSIGGYKYISIALWPEMHFDHAYYYAINSNYHQSDFLYDSLCSISLSSKTNSLKFFWKIFFPDMIVYEDELIQASLCNEDLVWWNK